MNNKSDLQDAFIYIYYGVLAAWFINEAFKRQSVIAKAKQIERKEQEARGKAMMAFYRSQRQRLINEEMEVKNASTG